MKISVVIVALFFSFSLCQAEDAAFSKQTRIENIKSIVGKLDKQMANATLKSLGELNPNSCWDQSAQSDLHKAIKLCEAENKEDSLKELEAALGRILIQFTLPLL